MKLIGLLLCISIAGCAATDVDVSGTAIAKILKSNAAVSSVEDIVKNLKDRYGVTPTLLFNARTERDIDLRSRLPFLNAWMVKKIAEEYNINVGVAFDLLGKIGQLLRISYAGCKGFGCQVPVTDVISQYHGMIYDSLSVSNLFLRSTIRAVRYHKYAMRYLNRDRYEDYEKIEKAHKWLARCGGLADKLVLASGEMVDKTGRLWNITRKAVLRTAKDQVNNKQNIRETEAKFNTISADVNDYQARQKSLESRETEMKKELEDLKKKIEEYEKKYEKKEGEKIKTNEICQTDTVKGFGLTIPISTFAEGGFSLPDEVIKTCYNELDKGAVEMRKTALDKIKNDINELREKQLELLKMKNGIGNNMTDLCGRLAKSMSLLKSTVTEKDELKRAETALQVAEDALILVKIIFLNNKHYWKQITENAKNQGTKGDRQQTLEDIKAEGEEADIEMFTEEVHGSGFHWLALGKVSSDAKTAMVKAKKLVDKTIMSLPSHAEAEHLIKTESAKVLESVKNMLASLDNMKVSTKEQIDAAAKEIADQKESDKKMEKQEEEEQSGLALENQGISGIAAEQSNNLLTQLNGDENATEDLTDDEQLVLDENEDGDDLMKDENLVDEEFDQLDEHLIQDAAEVL